MGKRDPLQINEVVITRRLQGRNDRNEPQFYPAGTRWKGGEIVERLGSKEEAARLTMLARPHVLVTVYGGKRDETAETEAKRLEALLRDGGDGAGGAAAERKQPSLPKEDAAEVQVREDLVARLYNADGDVGDRGSLRKLDAGEVRDTLTDETFEPLQETLKNGGWLLVTDDGAMFLFNHKKAAQGYLKEYAEWRVELEDVRGR